MQPAAGMFVLSSVRQLAAGVLGRASQRSLGSERTRWPKKANVRFGSIPLKKTENSLRSIAGLLRRRGFPRSLKLLSGSALGSVSRAFGGSGRLRGMNDACMVRHVDLV